MTVWLNGRLVDDTAATISVFDHGVTTGDGVFETAKVVDGIPFALRRHLDRLQRSAEGLGLRPDLDQIRAGVTAVLAAESLPLGRLRITVTGGRAPLGSTRGDNTPTLIVAAAPTQPWPATADVVVVPWRRNERAATAGLKTTSYADNVVALHWAHERGADEALFANTRDELCEGTGTNIFVGLGGRLVTPPLSSGCLPGITRDLLLEWVDCAEESLPLAAVTSCDEAFLASSTRDVQPIRAIDGRVLPAPGPLTARAMEVFAERAAANSDP